MNDESATIGAAAVEFTATYRRLRATSDDFWHSISEVDYLDAPDDPERWRVEFFLEHEDPIVRVIVDSRHDDAVFTHAAGVDESGARCTELTLHGDDAAYWRDIAAEYADEAGLSRPY